MSTRILIIDDEPRWISFVRNDLGNLFEVEVATNLESAMTKLRENHYKLIIVGSRCLDILQAFNKKYPGKRVIVATGQPTTREAIDAYRLGAFDYFTKDFQPGILPKRLKCMFADPNLND